MIRYAIAASVATAITFLVLASINYGSIAAVALRWSN